MGNAITLKTADRAILVGASGTGKSTLAKYLLDTWRLDYPKSRIMVVDTKPRWRGTYTTEGENPRKLYSRMAKGDEIKGAVTLGSMADWALAWDKGTNPSQTVVVQRIQQGWKDRSATQAATVGFALSCIERFYATASAKTQSLLYIDECHDFYSPNGSARGSDIIQRCYRAGREIGLTSLSGFQRPVGLNLQMLTELNYLALFRINYTKDARRLVEYGWPLGTDPPTYDEKYCFKLWRDGQPTAPTFRLTRKADR
jgi:energy-coupling factor transporter ATP-binding protein EcfA2